MNKKEQIKEILEELYLIDESLKEYQVELEKIVEKLLAAKPEVEINEEFKQKLRRELLARIEEIEGRQSVKLNKFMSIFSFNRLSYGIVGGVLSLIIVFGGVYYANQRGFLIGQPELSLKTEFSKESVSEGAFGSLRETALVSGDASGELGIGSAAGIGGGRPLSGGGGMVMPDITQYRYLYKGTELVLEDDKVEVLKREKGRASSGITNLVKGMNLGLIDLSGLSNTRMDSVSFVEEKDFGYSVYLNFREGSLSLHNNMLQGWQEVLGMCYGGGCVRPEPINEADIPEEGKIIEIADNFIKKYGIRMDSYGQPETRLSYILEQLQRAGEGYSPDSVEVIYPLMINGRYVYGQWGNKIGLNLNVNLRAMRVTNLYNLTTQNYQSSLYQAETDVSKILKALEKGGFDQPVYARSSKTVDVEVGEPTLAYVKIWRHNRGESDEFITSALVFPIDTSQFEGNYKREVIVVPLAKELLEDNDDLPILER